MHFQIDKQSFERLIDQQLTEIASDIFTKSQENLVKNGSIDTGELLKTASINSNFLEKEIVYPALHASFIEYGTNPHHVGAEGIKALQGWAMRKLGKNEKEAKSIAFAIATNIAKNGMRAQPFLRPAFEYVMGGI